MSIAAVASSGIPPALLPAFPRAEVSRAALDVLQAPDVVSGSAIEAVDVVLDLSRGSRNVLGSVFRLDKDQLQEFLRITAELLQQGIVGTETLEVRGEPYVSYLPDRIADPRLRDAPRYRDRRSIPTPFLDIRV